MPILIDTNILLRSVQPSHAMHPIAVRALESLIKREDALVVAVQNVAEFWNVATRPTNNNGLGFTLEEAREEIAKIDSFFQILSESQASFAVWKNLVISRRVGGVQVHDARLVSVMVAESIAAIVTFNVADFARYPEIEVVHPEYVAS